jgi:hypothetical protein
MSSKCSFAQTKIKLLGHVIEHGRIRMDPAKVQAIQEWQPPTNIGKGEDEFGECSSKN